VRRAGVRKSIGNVSENDVGDLSEEVSESVSESVGKGIGKVVGKC
jgi:hypothetical protein